MYNISNNILLKFVVIEKKINELTSDCACSLKVPAKSIVLYGSLLDTPKWRMPLKFCTRCYC